MSMPSLMPVTELYSILGIFPPRVLGITRAIAWVARRTEANADTLWVIEGAASYGAILAGVVAAHGFSVAETRGWTRRITEGSENPIHWTLTG